MSRQAAFVDVEAERILDEYDRRRSVFGAERYAPWQPAELLLKFERNRLAAHMLRKRRAFPGTDTRCLEIGYGNLGWLADLISWGVRESNLHGIELSRTRAEEARHRLPVANLRVGDAACIPWEDSYFELVIASTVFSSILDQRVRTLVASEMVRVLAPGGTVIWYDLAVNNPRNPNVRAIGRTMLRELFPGLDTSLRSVSLAAPIARRLAACSWTLATIAACLPFLKTHLLGVLVKSDAPRFSQCAERQGA